MNMRAKRRFMDRRIVSRNHPISAHWLGHVEVVR